MSKIEANKLWDDLRSAFMDVETIIQQIIDTRAWEPLGFLSFHDAWKNKMSGITIASEIRTRVIYQFLDEGKSDIDIALSVKGVSENGVKVLRRQKENGVSFSHATTIVREHSRKTPPAVDHVVHVDVGVARLVRWRKIAKKNGVSVEEVLISAGDEIFSTLKG